MAPVYRDHQHALRHRLAEARRCVEELEASVTPAFWRVLPRAAALEIARLRDDAADARGLPESIEALARYADRLGALVGDATSQLDAWNRAPETCPPPRPDEPGFPWRDLFGFRPKLPEAVTEGLHARVASITAKLDRARALGAFGRHGVIATMRVDAAPFVLTAVPKELRGWSARGLTEVSMALRTSVPRGAGRIALRPGGDDLNLLAFIARRTHVTFGDPEFDGWFAVDAEPGAANVALGPAVRASLCAVARDDAPTLEVSDGVAELRWRFEPSHGTVRAAVDALRAIRAAPPMPLLRESSRRAR